MMNTATEKSRLRASAAGTRAGADRARRIAAAEGLAHVFVEGLAEALDAASCVSLYWPMGDEIDVRPLMAALRARGLAIALPVMQGRDRALGFRVWEAGAPLVHRGFGVDEPAVGAWVRPEVIGVPLLAFDAAGNRLGYGGGYYDRTLRAARAEGAVLAAGVAYDEQEVACVPVDSGDERLDAVATDRRLIDLRIERGQRG